MMSYVIHLVGVSMGAGCSWQMAVGIGVSASTYGQVDGVHARRIVRPVTVCHRVSVPVALERADLVRRTCGFAPDTNWLVLRC